MFLTFFNHCCKFTPSQPSADAHECRLRGKEVLKRIFEEDFPHPKENFFASQKGNYCFVHEYVESKVDNVFIIRVGYRQIIEQPWHVNEFKHLYLYVIWDFRADEPRFMIEVNSKSKKSTDVVRMVFEHTLNKTLEECGCYLTFERQEGIIDMPECVRPVLSLLRDEDRSLEGFHKVPDIGEYYKKKERMNQHADDDFEMVNLVFFNTKMFGTYEKQLALRNLLMEVFKQIALHTGRDLVAVYIAFHFLINHLRIIEKFTDFFQDIDRLMPNMLPKVKDGAIRTKRYKSYIESLSTECKKWFIVDGSLPDIRIWKSNDCKYQVDNIRRKRIQSLVTDIYQRMKNIIDINLLSA